MIYAINYDLKRPGQDYKALYEAIKTCGDWWHYLGSTWLVDTSLSAQGIFHVGFALLGFDELNHLSPG